MIQERRSIITPKSLNPPPRPPNTLFVCFVGVEKGKVKVPAWDRDQSARHGGGRKSSINAPSRRIRRVQGDL